GIEGGIPTITNIFCDVTLKIPGTNIVAIAGDENDDSVAINAALNLCPTGQVVYLPAGNYVCSNQINLNRSFVVLRGAGMSQTVLKSYSGTAVLIGGSININPAYSPTANLNGSFEKGTSNIVLR